MNKFCQITFRFYKFQCSNFNYFFKIYCKKDVFNLVRNEKSHQSIMQKYFCSIFFSSNSVFHSFNMFKQYGLSFKSFSLKNKLTNKIYNEFLNNSLKLIKFFEKQWHFALYPTSLAGCCFSKKNKDLPCEDNMNVINHSLHSYDDSAYTNDVNNQSFHVSSISPRSEYPNDDIVSLERKVNEKNQISDINITESELKDLFSEEKLSNKSSLSESCELSESLDNIDQNFKKRKYNNNKLVINKKVKKIVNNLVKKVSKEVAYEQSDKANLLQGQEKSVDISKKPIVKKPNYFVAFQISSSEIHVALKEVQQHILEQDKRMKQFLNALPTLHITLLAIHIDDLQVHARALEALNSIHNEYNTNIVNNPLRLEFKGLGHFQNRVLYAKIVKDNSYERLCDIAESVKNHFFNQQIYSCDEKTFQPHLTVAKLRHNKKPRDVRKIDPTLYTLYKDQYFGTQQIQSIQLLSMLKPKTKSGYYQGNEISFSMPAISKFIQD